MASGLVNGFGIILLIIFVDPKLSILADEVINHKGSYVDLKSASIIMVTSQFIGHYMRKYYLSHAQNILHG